jgi:acetamidase/formamidase
MATTHAFPDDRVHFTWDADNEPVLTIASGDTVRYETRCDRDPQGRNAQLGVSGIEAQCTASFASRSRKGGAFRRRSTRPGDR